MRRAVQFFWLPVLLGVLTAAAGWEIAIALLVGFLLALIHLILVLRSSAEDRNGLIEALHQVEQAKRSAS